MKTLIQRGVVCALHRGKMTSLKEVGLYGFFVCVANGSTKIVLKMLSKIKMETNIFACFAFDKYTVFLYCEQLTCA